MIAGLLVILLLVSPVSGLIIYIKGQETVKALENFSAMIDQDMRDMDQAIKDSERSIEICRRLGQDIEEMQQMIKEFETKEGKGTKQ